MKLTKRKRIALAVLAALLLAQVATYNLWAHRCMPVAGLHALDGYPPPTPATFALFARKSLLRLSAEQSDALLADLHRHARTLYHDPAQIPEHHRETGPVTQADRDSYQRLKGSGRVPRDELEAMQREIESGRRLLGYSGGCRLDYQLGDCGLFWMRCKATWWATTEGARLRNDLHVWILFRWVCVSNTTRAA